MTDLGENTADLRGQLNDAFLPELLFQGLTAGERDTTFGALLKVKQELSGVASLMSFSTVDVLDPIAIGGLIDGIYRRLEVVVELYHRQHVESRQ